MLMSLFDPLKVFATPFLQMLSLLRPCVFFSVDPHYRFTFLFFIFLPTALFQCIL